MPACFNRRCSRAPLPRRTARAIARSVDTGAHDPFAPSRSPRPRRAIGVGPHPHGLLQGQPVSSGMLDERAGDSAAPKLSGGLSLGPLSSRRIQVSVCGPARKTHLRFTYKGSPRCDVYRVLHMTIPVDQSTGTCLSRHVGITHLSIHMTHANSTASIHPHD